MTAAETARWSIEHFEGFKYTDDPVDKGGATKFGITLRTLAYYREKYLGAPKGETTKQYVENLTLDEAVTVAVIVFMKEPGYDVLEPYPRTLLVVFDYGFHSGQPRATKALQVGINEVLRRNVLEPDGVIGKRTREYLEIIGKPLGDVLLANSILTQRQEFMQIIMERDLTQRRFMLGWWKRTTKLQRKIAEA